MNIPTLRTGEDIIYDEDAILDETEQSEMTGESEPDETNDQENTNAKVHQLNTTFDQKIATIAEATGFENVEELIAQLPDNFPLAVETIKDEIGPIISNYDPGLVDHYVTVIKKKTNAPSKRSVKLIIDEIIKQLNTPEPDLEMDEEEFDDIPPDPEIQALADQIAQDPFLFKNRIELVNQLGVIGERKTIGLYTLVFDSCLLPMNYGESQALALKNSGQFGAGKSFPLFKCLGIYPKSAYHLISNGSPKSLYSVAGGLQHKCLILTEALALENSGRSDNELAYSIRTLVSEGHLKYQYTGFKDKVRVTIVKKLEGPTSLLTTTVKGKLEAQLEDRLITAHPNTSAKQTQDIIDRTADLATGNGGMVDEKIISAYKLFHENLEPVEVVIPFAIDISDFITRNGSLPTSARRAFKRVLSAIKTITLIYQKQRGRDDLGRVIAEISDYAIAVQLINESFGESLGEGKRYTDERIKIIDKHGMISSKDLAKVTGVSVAAISQWMKQWIENGVLIWCDENDEEFTDMKLLEKAKRSGKAFIRVAGFNRLPTPYELTGDKSWDVDGDSYQMYDLELGVDPVESEVLSTAVEESNASIDFSDDVFDNVKIINPDDNGGGVKVLINNTSDENGKVKIDQDTDKILADDEFGAILSGEKLRTSNSSRDENTDELPELVKPKNKSYVDGILTI